MLSVQEALLMKAVQDEIEREEATQLGGALGATGGALLGAGVGAVPHSLGNAVNALKDKAAATRGMTPAKKPLRALKPGYRMAGGLTGLILGGGLGAGAAAMMKQDSEAARLLGKIQAQGGSVDKVDEIQLATLLGNMYQNPSQLM